jgi:MFS family permease
MNMVQRPTPMRRFLALYTSANIGAHLAFVPLLSLLLPLKAEIIAPEDKLWLLSMTLLAGSVMASISNVLAGALSDRIFERSQSRAGQITFSLFFVLLSYMMFRRADDPASLIASILFFQFAFNFLFSPLGALLTDRVPDELKGRAAALLNLGMPMATLSIALLSIPTLADESVRLVLIAAAITVAILPVAWLIRKPASAIIEETRDRPTAPTDSAIRKDFIWAWSARLFVQFSGAVMLGYLLYFLQDVVQYTRLFPRERVDQGMGKLTLAATPVTIVIGIFAGAISDRSGLRRPFLMIAPLVIAAAILTMSLYPSWPVIFICYIVFICGLTIFLTTDAALVAQLLSGDRARARKLGIMNLTNTIPAVIAPATALLLSGAVMETDALVLLMQIAATLAILAAFAASRIKTIA